MTFPARPICALAVWSGLLLTPAGVAAQGERIAAEVCASCHGERGVSVNPLVPTLAGQPYTLIEDNLLAFRAGKRSCGPRRNDGSAAAALAQTMCALVAELGDGDIASLAAFFSAQSFVPAEQDFEEGLARQGAELHARLGCERCHAGGGTETLGIAPVLAGQWTPYLRRALRAVHAGTRKVPKEMTGPIRTLGDGEIEALLHYYAGRREQSSP